MNSKAKVMDYTDKKEPISIKSDQLIADIKVRVIKLDEKCNWMLCECVNLPNSQILISLRGLIANRPDLAHQIQENESYLIEAKIYNYYYAQTGGIKMAINAQHIWKAER